MAITKKLGNVVNVEIADIEATEDQIELPQQPEIAAKKLRLSDVDVYTDVYKYGRPVRVPKGALWNLLQMVDAQGKHPFTQHRPKDYVEPEYELCLVDSCPTKIAVEPLTPKQIERAKTFGITEEEYKKNHRRRALIEHMKAFHPAEMRDFFGEQKE